MSYVSREKYNNLKEEAKQLSKNCNKMAEKMSIIHELEEELNKFEEKCLILKKENDVLKIDNESDHELENVNRSLKKEIKSLKRDNNDLNEKYKNIISQLERDILLKDGKIQRLEESKKDMKDRYNELREDFREQQRWNRDNK